MNTSQRAAERRTCSAPSHFSGRSTLLFCLLSAQQLPFVFHDLRTFRQRSTSCCIILPRTPVSLSTLLAEQGRQARAGRGENPREGPRSSDTGAAAAARTRCGPPSADPADTDGTAGAFSGAYIRLQTADMCFPVAEGVHATHTRSAVSDPSCHRTALTDRRARARGCGPRGSATAPLASVLPPTVYPLRVSGLKICTQSIFVIPPLVSNGSLERTFCNSSRCCSRQFRPQTQQTQCRLPPDSRVCSPRLTGLGSGHPSTRGGTPSPWPSAVRRCPWETAGKPPRVLLLPPLLPSRPVVSNSAPP